MHYDHVDIGTCDFDVADGVFSEDKRYLMVEPLAHYLERLPLAPHVVKEAAAISHSPGRARIYHVPEEVISSHKLPSWFRGCNKLGSKHPTVVKYLNLMRKDLSLIKETWVETNTLQRVFMKHRVSSVGMLKVDTEGHDHVVLRQMANMLLRGEVTCGKITVEYLPLSFDNTAEIDAVALELLGIFSRVVFNSEQLTLER